MKTVHRLVINAQKLQPCNPTVIQARDAFIAFLFLYNLGASIPSPRAVVDSPTDPYLSQTREQSGLRPISNAVDLVAAANACRTP